MESFTAVFYMYSKFHPCSSSFIGAQLIEVKKKHVFRNTLYLEFFHYVFQKARHLEQKFFKRILRHFILGRLKTISNSFLSNAFLSFKILWIFISITKFLSVYFLLSIYILFVYSFMYVFLWGIYICKLHWALFPCWKYNWNNLYIA